MSAAESKCCTVRLATAADLSALTELCHEMERHYDGPAAVGGPIIRQALERELLGNGSGVRIFVADMDGALIGLATASMTFPAAQFAPALFVKDIYVATSARSRGIGTALLRALARFAVDRGCTRVNWTTARDNTRALALYCRLGARVSEEAAVLRLDGDALARLATEAGDG